MPQRFVVQEYMEDQPTDEQMEETFGDEAADLKDAIADEKYRLQSLLEGINADRIQAAGYGALAVAVILNLFCLLDKPDSYMVLWILSSLYFYLIYPLIPLAFILIPGLFRKTTEKREGRDPLLPWLKNLHLVRNHRIVIQLAIRFFLLGIMPLTSGMVLIYSLSLVYAILLGAYGDIPLLTSLLIIVQCLGILIFYLDLSCLKRQFSFFTRSLAFITSDHWVRYLLMAIFGVLVVIIASCATIILLIAILMPGFTLGAYVDAASLIQERADIRILLLFMCQFIVMQYFQSVLSRRIARTLCSDQLVRIEEAEAMLAGSGTGSVSPVSRDKLVEMVLPLVIESRIHGITRMHMGGLFPTYTIGLDIDEIFRIRSLEELSGMFRK